MKGEPILIACEGGHQQPAQHLGHYGMCAMCGRIYPIDSAGYVVRHDRDDIIARVERGDFDE